jgi:hypothetical protein
MVHGAALESWKFREKFAPEGEAGKASGLALTV